MAFFDNIKFPFFTMQELNLDWLLKEVKRIAGFMPQDGNVGDVLTRKSDGAEWEPPDAVNININALPEDTAITDNDQLVFYDISASANRKIKPPNLLDSMMSNGSPLMDGTASPGTSKKPARYDHKHPTDTSRQAALSGEQMNAVNSGAPASCFSSNKLKIENGGTGASSAASARANLGISSYQWQRLTLNANSSETLTFPNYAECICVFTGFGANAMGMTILTRLNTTLVKKDVSVASDVSISMDSNGVVTFANTSSSAIQLLWCQDAGTPI